MSRATFIVMLSDFGHALSNIFPHESKVGLMPVYLKAGIASATKRIGMRSRRGVSTGDKEPGSGAHR